jgi:hypothetical protein
VCEPGADGGLSFAGDNILIVNARNINRSFAAVNASLDIIILYGDYARALEEMANSLATGAISRPPAIFDLRRLYASLYLPFADVSVGRQIVNFGKGMLFSPVDVFTTVNIFDLGFRRRGSDVLRIQVPFGGMSGADFVTEIPGTGSKNSSAVKLYTNIADFDLSGVGIVREKTDEFVAGLTFKGDAFVGIVGELAQHFMGEWGDRFFEGMAGVDYSIRNKYFVLLEYYYNQREIPGTSTALHLIQNVERPFFKKHYMLISGRYRWNEIIHFSTSVIHNIGDNKSIADIQYFHSILQNANLTVYARWYNGNINGMEMPGAHDFEYGSRIEVSF